MELDKKDKKIIKVINVDARASLAEISKKTGLQRDSIKYRIDKMKKLGIIDFFHTVMDPNKFGYPIFAYVNFKFSSFTKEKEFFSFLSAMPNVVYVSKTTGRWDAVTAICAKDIQHYDEILKKIRDKFSDMIKDYEDATIIRQYKYDYMVDLIV